MNALYFAFTAIILTCYPSGLDGARILGAFVFPARSHHIVGEAVMTELARRGHEVTMITCHRHGEKLANFTEIVIEPAYNFWSEIQEAMGDLDVFHMTDSSIGDTLKMTNILGNGPTEHALKHPDVQHLIHSNDQQFDLLVVEQFFQEAFLMMAKRFNVPIVSVSSYGFDNFFSEFMGQITPWSHSPHPHYSYTDRMSFSERLHNVYLSLYTEYNKRFVHMPRQNEMAQKYFAHLPGPLPTIWELERNISVILMNNYVPLEYSLPKVMGMIPVGGIQIKPPKTLPRDIRQFLDEAHHGAIYFSLGSNVDSSLMPAEKLKAFINVFSKLKQYVVWRWGGDNVPDLPKNVMVKKWLPQTDILAHPHVKLFITHGGLLSTQESVYRSVPTLGIPFYGDQFLNTKRMADDGYGLYLNFKNITEASITWALQELLYKPEYMIRVREVSRIFRDRQSGAMDTAMFWVDYVIRHKGAPHLKSAAVYLPWYSLYLIDVMAFLLAITLVGILGLYFLIRLILKMTTKKKEKVYGKMN